MIKKMLLFFFLIITYSLKSQSFNTQRLDSLFTILAAKDMAMGSLAITENGRLGYQRAIGFAIRNKEGNITANIDTRYRIGSITKMFTATMIFQLVEEGQLQLDQTLGQFFPDIPNAGKIRLRDMLYHRSGLHDYTKDTNFADWMSHPKTQEELELLIRQKSPDFEPDSAADYSNTNFLLLGYIIEKLTGTNYGKALQQRITDKLNLKDTYYGQTMDPAIKESASYKFNDNNWKKVTYTDLSIHGGAGSIISTPADLTRFINALFTGKLIKQSSLEKMTTLIDDYGMGIFPFNHNKETGFGHNGRIEEFYSALHYYPGHKISICYITNGIDYPRTDIMEGIEKICFNEPFTIPFNSEQDKSAGSLDIYLGTYSSKELPMVITVTKKGQQLLIETQGKVFETSLVSPDYFMNSASGYFFQFDPVRNQLTVKETDNRYTFNKQH